MSILSKLAIISDSLSPSSDNYPFIDSAASFFMNSIPFELSKEYFIPIELTDGAGVVVGSKYSSVMLGKHVCRKIHAALKELAKDKTSQYFATSSDPVYYKQENKLFILPNPTATTSGILFKMPVTFVNDVDDTLENVPENAEHLIMIYAGHLILYSKARTARATVDSYISRIVGFITSYSNTLPTSLIVPQFVFADVVPNAPSLDFGTERFAFTEERALESIPDLNLVNVIDPTISVTAPTLDFNFIGILPTFEMPVDAFPTVDMTAAFTALSNAENFIGNANTDKGTVPKGAFWVDDEDPEMVQSSVQLASQEVNRANSIAQTTLTSLQTYNQKLQAQISKFEGEISAYTSEISAITTRETARVQLYSTQIDAAVRKIDAQIKKVQAEVEMKKLLLERNNINVQQINLRLQEYQNYIQQRLTFNQQELEQYNSAIVNFSTKLQKEMTIYQSSVQKVTQEFQAQLSLANQNAQPIQFVSNEFQLHASKYQMLMQEAGLLYDKYMNEFNRFLGSYASQENNRESRKV